jgi:hypothetical protein
MSKYRTSSIWARGGFEGLEPADDRPSVVFMGVDGDPAGRTTEAEPAMAKGAGRAQRCERKLLYWSHDVGDISALFGLRTWDI